MYLAKYAVFPQLIAMISPQRHNSVVLLPIVRQCGENSANLVVDVAHSTVVVPSEGLREVVWYPGVVDGTRCMQCASIRVPLHGRVASDVCI